MAVLGFVPIAIVLVASAVLRTRTFGGAFIGIGAIALVVACSGSSRDASVRDLGEYAKVYDNEAMQSSERAYQRECTLRAQAASPGAVPVDVSDGVDRCEAQAIADERIGELGCGAVGPPHDDEFRWLVPVRVDVDGRPLEPIQIDKQSGRVTGGSEPLAHHHGPAASLR